MKFKSAITVLAFMASASVIASPVREPKELTTPTATISSSTTATPTANPYGEYKFYGEYAGYGKYGAGAVKREANHDKSSDAKNLTPPTSTTSSSATATPTANPYGNYKNYGQYAGYGKYDPVQVKREAPDVDSDKKIPKYGVYAGYNEGDYHN